MSYRVNVRPHKRPILGPLPNLHTHTHRHIEADIRIVLESMYLHEMFGH